MKRFFCALFEHIEYIIIIFLFAGIVFVSLTFGSYGTVDYKNPEYASMLFDESFVHKIEVNMDESDYEDMLVSPREKTKYHASVAIDGETFSDVAFSTRGNGSLRTVSETEYSDRYSFTVNFQKFNKGNTYHGLDKLILNGLYFEKSYLRSYLAFNLASHAGALTPLKSFTKLYINGELKGLYLALEAIDESFLSRNGSSKDAALFHPIPYAIDWDKRYADEQYYKEGETITVETEIESPDFDFGGSDLVYHGEDPENYPAIFKNATTKYSKKDEAMIISGIKSLEDGGNPEEYWDMDAVISFFVAAALVPTLDSYVGYYAQNYYLLESDDKLSLIPWDYDGSFRVSDLQEGISEEDGAILWPIDSLAMYAEDEERPLWYKVLSDEDYLAEYHERLQSVLKSYLISDECLKEFNEAVELIRDYVYADPARPSTTEEFEEEVEYLRNFISKRTESIQNQLWGLLPKKKIKRSYESYRFALPKGVLEEDK